MVSKKPPALGFNDYIRINIRREHGESWEEISQDYPHITSNALRRRFGKLNTLYKVDSRETPSKSASRRLESETLNHLPADTDAALHHEVDESATLSTDQRNNPRKRRTESDANAQAPAAKVMRALDLLSEDSLDGLRQGDWGFRHSDRPGDQASNPADELVYDSSLEKLSKILQKALKKHSDLESMLRRLSYEKDHPAPSSEPAQRNDTPKLAPIPRPIHCNNCEKVKLTLKERDRMIRNCESIESDLRHTIKDKDAEVAYVRQLHADNITRHDQETSELKAQNDELQSQLGSTKVAFEKAQRLMEEQLHSANQELTRLEAQIHMNASTEKCSNLTRPVKKEESRHASPSSSASFAVEHSPHLRSNRASFIKATQQTAEPETPQSMVSKSGIDPHLLTLTAKKQRASKAVRNMVKKGGYCYQYHLNDGNCSDEDCKARHGELLEGEQKSALASLFRKALRKGERARRVGAA